MFSKDKTELICYPASKSGSAYTIPDSVTSIANGAFNCCVNIASVVIPDGVTTIGNGTFYGCDSLTSIEIPDSVTSIGDYAFAWCSSLTSIEISESVTYIGDDAFEDSALETIYGYAGSYAETYANENGYEFISLDETDPESVTLLGDINGDSEVNAADLTALSRHVAKIETITNSTLLANSDLDHNGIIEAADLTILSRYVAKIIDRLE